MSHSYLQATVSELNSVANLSLDFLFSHTPAAHGHSRKSPTEETSPSEIMQDTRTLSQSSSSPDVGTTNPHGRSGSEVNERERNGPSQYSVQNVSEL
ncbi:hypothetical protein AZE42_04460 [Rhizopogon vesiculosus]|uniref:Uncharacterized protein n=1 Tax=Rhizopogon vesiculosus TaxID=180088 RepID=A0A1J8QEC7_9AGAM|nr:hypothetical protein AZE42_04460 [Rhizopogon vesiculosus]